MHVRSVATVVRIVVLFILVIVATMGGSRMVSTQFGDDRPPATVEVSVTPTEVALIDLSSTATEVVAPTQGPVYPTAEPTVQPTLEPTTEPKQTGRGTFPVPENTTGRSIVVERGPEDKKWVALTFDAGEGPGYTTEILDLLLQYNLKASFGATGEWARENPDLVNRILDEGHLLFNHSESHLSWTGSSPGTEPLTAEQRTAEVMGAHDAVLEVADWNMQPFWRPPYGDLDAEGQALLSSLGYDYTFWWTCDTLAWTGVSAAEIAAACASDTDKGGPGAIILMHVSQEQDYLAVESIIQDYQAEGYEFVTLNEMVGS